MLLRTGKFLFKSFTSQTSFKPLSFTNKFFITEKKELDINKQPVPLTPLQLRQRAELALDIYELILQKPANLDLKEKSLHDMIMKTIHQQKLDQPQKTSKSITGKVPPEGKKYPQEVRKPFIEMFDEGFKIDTQIFSQERIKDALIQVGSIQKLVFHPTYLITSQVFNQLLRLRQHRRILTGHRGISKTFSVCLFWHLIKFIDQYRFQKGVQVSEKMMRVPKLVYWSIGFENKDPKQLILDQCPQITTKYGNSYNWEIPIKKFYQEQFPKFLGFYVILVIDQINQVASVGRKLEQNKKIEDLTKKIKISDNQLALFYKGQKYIPFFIMKFDGFLGLSSMNIEQLFFKQIQMTQFTNTTMLPIQRVKFSQKIYEEASLRQLVDYFVFEMDQRIFKKLSPKTISELDKKAMKGKCFDYLCEKLNKKKKEYFFFTPYDIRQQIDAYIKTSMHLFESPQKPFLQIVLNSFETMIDKSIENHKAFILDKFYKKDSQDENRIKFMFSVYNYLVQHQNQKVPSIFIKDVHLGWCSNLDQIEDFIDKRIFQFDRISKSLTLMLPSSFMKQAIEPSLKKYNALYTDFTLKLYEQTKNNGLLGILVENQLTAALNKGDIYFSFDLKNEKVKDKNINYEFNITQGIYTFKHLQTKCQNSSQKTNQVQNSNKDSSKNGQSQQAQIKDKNSVKLLTRFQDIIKSMLKKQRSTGVAFPVTKDYQQKQQQLDFDLSNIVPTSKCIDFVLIQKYFFPNSKLISIWLIDVTVSKDKIRQKIQDFIEQFLTFADKNVTELLEVQNTPSVEINYVVFGPKHNLKYDNFSIKLEKKFSNEITFKTLEKSNVFTVQKLKNSKSCTLKRICYIDLESNLKFIKNLKSIEQIQTLKKLLKNESKSKKKKK